MANPIPNEMKIGTVGELLVQLRLLQYDVQAAPPLKDSGNDLIALKGYAVRCVQVKTTTNDIPAWPPEEKLYHLLAVVRLEGDGRNLHLDASSVYLLSREEAGRVTRSWDGLERFKLNEDRIATLFATAPNDVRI
jgi:hypothetical protein